MTQSTDFNPLGPYTIAIATDRQVMGYEYPSCGASTGGGWGHSYTATRPSQFKRDRATLGGDGDKHLDHLTLWEMREICLALDRENGLSHSAIDRCVENILGPEGFALYPRTEDAALNERISQAWWDWLVEICDPAGTLHGNELFEVFYRSAIIQGDQAFQWDEDAGDGWGQLISIEAPRILNPSGKNTVNGLPMIHGIAKKNGRPEWYWIADEVPDTQSVSPRDGRAYSADTIELFVGPRRISNSRGQGVMSPVVRDIDDLDDCIMFERVGSKLATAMGVFVETEDPSSDADYLRELSDPEGHYSAGYDRIEKIVPGRVEYVKPGQKVKLLQGNRPSADMQKFFKLIIKFIGLPLGLPYELMMLDCEDSTLGTLRVTLQFAQRCFQKRQARFGWFKSRIYKRWILNAVRQGRFPDRADITYHEWGYPGWPSPQPVQDAQAAAIGIKNGFQSATGAARQTNRDIEQVRNERREDFAAEPELKPVNPQDTNTAGGRQK